MTELSNKITRRVNATLVTLFAICLTILLLYNVRMFLVRQGKYKNVLHSVFYVVAVVTIALVVTTAWQSFQCDGFRFFLIIIVPYLTLAVGNYLAAYI